MEQKNILLAISLILAVGVVGYFFYSGALMRNTKPEVLDPTPRNVTLSGTYVCLPHLDTEGPQTMECAFGLKTDDGVYYAVNFGQGENSMSQFQSGQHIKAEGFVVIKEALSSDQWAKYNMKGIFTITKMIEPAAVSGKININVVCEQALTYMTFANGEAAAKFVAECKEGKHPEVIEHYKAELNLGEGVAI